LNFRSQLVPAQTIVRPEMAKERGVSFGHRPGTEGGVG